MDRDDILLNPRCAGNVLRYHTWPTIQKQTVADHTFHVLRIYSESWPNDMFKHPEITFAILRHDMAEIATGDIPFPIKRDNPVLKTEMDRLEYEQMRRMGWEDEMVPISDPYKTRIKLCDLCEMYEFGIHEEKLGNKFAKPIIEHVSHNIHKIAYGNPDYSAIFSYMNRINK